MTEPQSTSTSRLQDSLQNLSKYRNEPSIFWHAFNFQMAELIQGNTRFEKARSFMNHLLTSSTLKCFLLREGLDFFY